MKKIISEIRNAVDPTTQLGFCIAIAIDNGTPHTEVLMFINTQGMDEPSGMAKAIGWKLTKELLQLA
jgi:hypothetical protein